MKDDRRSRRTRRLVTAAMAELLLERPFDEITVQAILDRADVGRSTFYQHFRDKLDVIDAVAAEMVEGATAGGAGGLPPSLPIAELFRHAAERYKSLRAMLDVPGNDVFWRESQAAWAAAIEASIAAGLGRQRAGVPPAVAAQFITGAAVAVLKWWLREGMPYPPEQIASMVESLVPQPGRIGGSPI
jgi:AcrR family transcriptional regulator